MKPVRLTDDEWGGSAISRGISLLLFAVYVVGGYVAGGPGLSLKILGFCIVPLACVWFPEGMGAYKSYGYGHIGRESPASFVWVLGWIVLLLPAITAAIFWIASV